MPKLRHCWAVCLLSSALCSLVQAADPVARPTHVLQSVILEVAPTRPDKNPWDTGVGSFARPDLQVTLMRHDAKALQAASALYVQVHERLMKELGQPVPEQFKDLLARNAIVSLRCGATVDEMQDQALKDARAKFVTDSAIVTDSLLARLVDAGLQVAVGDKVSIFVHDIDLAAHDLMGQADLEITKELIAKGEIELKFGSVESLRLKLTPIGK